MTAGSPPPTAVAGRRASRPQRRIERRAGLPGSRAVVGGLLVVLAAVGVYLAYSDATTGPATSYVVAADDLRPGDPIRRDDLRSVAIDLPPGVAEGAFSSPRTLLDRIVVAPLTAGEVVQASAVSEQVPSQSGREVALALPRSRVAAGRLEAGDRIDVYVTDDERTSVAARHLLVVELSAGAGARSGDDAVEVVVTVPDEALVVALVDALRTGEVTVVRSTFAGPGDRQARGGTGSDHGRELPDAR